MPKKIKGAKIALLDVNLQKEKLKMGVQVTITDPNEIDGVQKKEITMITKRIKMMLDAGANVIMTTAGIDDLCVKYISDAGAIGIRRCEMSDLKKIGKLTGGTVISSFYNLEGEESYEASFLGEAEEVAEERIADEDLIYIKVRTI
jgi:T-complex protein 1 subunit alpha